MKKLINEPLGVVDDLLAAMVATTPRLSLIEGQRVIVRSDIEAFRASGKVALISGGGTGHEPAHAGYVGKGMLCAAVCGDVFTSPPTESVIAAIRAVAGPAGVLLIIKNYTGDRLNFKLAAEMARSEGIAVETVVVADDVALARSVDNAGRRGIAGTILVHKAAGAAAERGLPLAEVAAVARKVADAVGSMGVALTSCIVPAVGRPNFELGEYEMEFGLGIHGEPGVERRTIAPVREIVDTLVDRIAKDKALATGARVGLIVNNLGATPPMEVAIAAGEALTAAGRLGLKVERLWSGTLLSALDMAGISVSLLALDDELLGLLDAPTLADAWPGSGSLERSGPSHLPAIARPSAPRQTGEASPAFGKGLVAAMETLVASENDLTELDRLSGDGDLGSNLARGATSVLSRQTEFTTLDGVSALRELSALVGKSVGGTSGVLYAAGLLRAANALAAQGDRGGAAWAAALLAGAEGIAEIGEAQPGDRTMLDALLPAARRLQAAIAEGKTGGRALAEAVGAAQDGAAATAAMVSRRGRSSYLGDRVVGHADGGASAVALWLKAISDALG